MLSLVIIWLYTAIILVAYGVVVVKLLGYLFNNEKEEYPHLSVIFILGLCLITTVAGYLSLFMKLGLCAFVVVSLPAFLLIYYYIKDISGIFKGFFKKIYSLQLYLIVIFSISILFILIKATHQPVSVDTGLYHAQAIKWIEDYRVVPGLGNLHGRLAFNFSWFLPSALFSFSFLKIQPFHYLNPLLLIFVLIMSVEAAGELMKGENSLSNIMKLALMLPVMLVFKDQLSSPNVDLPAALIIIVTFIYFIEMTEDQELAANDMRLAIITILAAYVTIIKLSSIPIMIFALYVFGNQILGKKIKEMLWLSGIVLIIFIPWVIRNIILSGYLIYPFPALDLFNFDWKIPYLAAVAEKQAIANYARNPGLIPDAWLARGLSAWFPSWLNYVTTAYRKKLELILLPSLLIVGGIIVNIFREKCLKFDYQALRRLKIVYLTAVSGCIFWFVTAPDLRFGFGFIMVASVLIWLPLKANYRPGMTRLVVLLIGMVLIYFEIAFVAGDLASLKSHLVLPAPYPQVAVKAMQVDGRVVFAPKNKDSLCWYAPLPCTPCPVSGLEFRGPSLQDGFRRKME